MAEETRCPTCGAPAERGQLVCLECGRRLALDYRRPHGWKVATGVVAAVVLLAAAGSAVALNAISDDAEQEAVQRGATRTPEPGQRTEPPARTQTEPSERRRERPRRRGGVPSWPAGRRAFTVVLLSAEDRRTATQFARRAREAGVPAGVLDADRYPGLGEGFWLVFAGVHETRARAERAADRLGRRYSGAYVQLVDGTRAG